MSYNYPYPINKEINPDRFSSEVKSSTIIPDFYISGSGSTYIIYFKVALTTDEQTTLNTIITNHEPTPLEPESDVLKTTDKRYIVKTNSRPLFTSGYFTARDDNPANPKDIGGGSNYAEVNHKVGDVMSTTITQRFNVEGNRSWIFEGYVNHDGAKFDKFTFYISAMATPYTSSTNTGYKLYSYLIIPAAGNGTVSIDTSNLTTLVSVVPRTDTGLYPTAYWDADFDSTTGKYGNLTPNLTGTGKYNMFNTEVILKKYINHITLLGSKSYKFETSDPSELGSNLLCNYAFETTAPDHDWQCAVYVSMFREKII